MEVVQCSIHKCIYYAPGLVLDRLSLSVTIDSIITQFLFISESLLLTPLLAAMAATLVLLPPLPPTTVPANNDNFNKQN